MNQVKFDGHHPVCHLRSRNRSAEPRQSDKAHDHRPPSVNAIRSVVPERSQQDQLPICFRPDSGGSKGQHIQLYTNHFRCYLSDELAIVCICTRCEHDHRRYSLHLESIHCSCQCIQTSSMVQCKPTATQSFRNRSANSRSRSTSSAVCLASHVFNNNSLETIYFHCNIVLVQVRRWQFSLYTRITCRSC
jgi:hypothetical protein